MTRETLSWSLVALSVTGSWRANSETGLHRVSVQFIFKILPQTPDIFLSFFIVFLSEERKWLECFFVALGEIGLLKATPCFQIVLYCLFIFDQYSVRPWLHTDHHTSSIFHSCNYASAEEKEGGDGGPVG